MKSFRSLWLFLLLLLFLWRVLDFWGEWTAGRFHMTLEVHVLYDRPALYLQALIIVFLFVLLSLIWAKTRKRERTKEGG